MGSERADARLEGADADGELTVLVYEDLRKRGFKAYLDIEDVRRVGRFDEELKAHKELAGFDGLTLKLVEDVAAGLAAKQLAEPTGGRRVKADSRGA